MGYQWDAVESASAESADPESVQLAFNVTDNQDGVGGVVAVRNPRHRFSVMLLSTSQKSVECSSADESLGLKSANFLEIITIPMTNFSCQGRQQGYFVDRDIFCRVFGCFIP